VKVLYAVKFSQQPRPRVMYVTREGRREAFTGETMGWVLSGESGRISRCRSRSVLETHPEDHEILREIGFAYRKKGIKYYDEAEDYIRRALEKNDLDVEGHGMLGGLLKRKELYNEALHHYERAYELDSTDLYPLINLGVINAALGKIKQATDWYRKVDTICKELIDSRESDYWTYLCRLEAAVAVNDKTTAFSCWSDVKLMDVPTEDIRSQFEQLEFFVKIGFANVLATQLIEAIRNDVLHPCENT